MTSTRVRVQLSPACSRWLTTFIDATSYIIYDADSPTVEGYVDEYLSMPDIELVPVKAESMQPATATLEVTFEFDTMDDGTNHAVFSGSYIATCCHRRYSGKHDILTS